MTEKIADYLLSPRGRRLTEQAMEMLEDGRETLSALTHLRRNAEADQVAAVWELANLRRKGVIKFGADASRMFFVGEALEQASSRRAAAYHARRFSEAGMTTVTDLCGGIGGDSIAFAQAGLHVTLVELDSVRALFAQENVRALNLDDQITVVQGDATTFPLRTEAVWMDPARRVNGRRIAHPDDYLPPLSLVHRLQDERVSHIGVKLAPAIDHAIAAPYQAELDFVSDGGECKEALLWLGALKSGVSIRATLVADQDPIWLGSSQEEISPPPADQQTLASALYLYEPDPAVIRAHLITVLGASLQADIIDPQIAYLIGKEHHPTPFADCYQILEQFPYQKKRLQTALTSRQVGHVVIKKRGFPLEPDAVRSQLKLKGPNTLTVVLTRRGNEHLAFLCQPV